MIDRVTGGKALPDEVLEQIVAKTDGVPLFLEELTKTVLESGLLREESGAYVLGATLTPLAIPSTLQDSLMARLDRLAPVKGIAQIGAAIGREFSYRLLEAVSPITRTGLLLEALDQLMAAELIYRRGEPPDATYVFKHALVQDTAYANAFEEPSPAASSTDRRGDPRPFSRTGGIGARNSRASFHASRSPGDGDRMVEQKRPASR